MNTDNVSTDIKLCPHCGGKVFAAKIIRGCLVESTDAGFKVLKESVDKFDIETVKCGRCKAEVTNDDLVNGVVCSSCGKVVSSSEMNEDGVCNVCQAQKERSELANASREDLIRMLLDAERKAKISVPDTKPTESVAEPLPEPVLEEPKETKKTRRAASRKKPDAPVTVEETQENGTSIDKTDSAANDIANQQVAPFPDVTLPEPDSQASVSLPEIPVSEPEEHFGINNFEMFQSDEKI